MSPISPSTPFSLAGDILTTVGGFSRAILSNPSKTLGGKYVVCNVEDCRYGDFLQLWGKATGKACAVLASDLRRVRQTVSRLERETGRMLLFYKREGDKSWNYVSGVELVTAVELRVQGELVPAEEAFMLIDLSPLDN